MRSAKFMPWELYFKNTVHIALGKIYKTCFCDCLIWRGSEQYLMLRNAS